jgi:archaellum biogenesis ATPase FlaH
VNADKTVGKPHPNAVRSFEKQKQVDPFLKTIRTLSLFTLTVHSHSVIERGTFKLNEKCSFQEYVALKNANISVCRIGPLSSGEGGG